MRAAPAAPRSAAHPLAVSDPKCVAEPKNPYCFRHSEHFPGSGAYQESLAVTRGKQRSHHAKMHGKIGIIFRNNRTVIGRFSYCLLTLGI